MILTQNEIDTVKDISSLEELKNYILNSSTNTELNHISSDNISIRILSLEEYNKYIKNGTCDGAINTYDINVWHSMESLNKDYDYYLAHKGSAVTASFDYYTELINNTSTNQSKILYQHNNFIYYVLGTTEDNLYNYRPGRRYYRSTYDNNSSHPKGFIYINGVLQISKNNYRTLTKTQTIAKTNDANSPAYNVIFNFYFNTLFRPVFQYKDNNKSKNLYY